MAGDGPLLVEEVVRFGHGETAGDGPLDEDPLRFEASDLDGCFRLEGDRATASSPLLLVPGLPRLLRLEPEEPDCCKRALGSVQR